MARVLGKTSFELGQRAMLRHQLEMRFGPLSEAASRRLEAVPADRIVGLALAMLQAISLAELGLEGPPGSSSHNGA